jgi:large subunit ribosomal protein L1
MKKVIQKTPRLSKQEINSIFEKVNNFNDIIDLLKKVCFAKFDESIEVSIRLTNKPKKTDKTIRGNISLPHSVIKKKPKIAVFATGEDVIKAKKAGAAFAGLEELIDEIMAGKIQYDYYVATKSVIGQIAKIARFLKGAMPSLKSGTVTEDVEATCKKLLEGVLQYRQDKGHIVHGKIGYKSFDNKSIEDNFRFFIKYLYTNYSNGRTVQEFIKSVYLSGTMSPSIMVNNNILLTIIKE